MLHSFHSQPTILPRHGVWTGTAAKAVIYSSAIHPRGQGGAVIADTSCSPNVPTEEPASALKNPASSLEKPTSLLASFLPQPGILQARCAAAFLLDTSSLHLFPHGGKACTARPKNVPCCNPPNSDEHLFPAKLSSELQSAKSNPVRRRNPSEASSHCPLPWTGTIRQPPANGWGMEGQDYFKWLCSEINEEAVWSYTQPPSCYFWLFPPCADSFSGGVCNSTVREVSLHTPSLTTIWALSPEMGSAVH